MTATVEPSRLEPGSERDGGDTEFQESLRRMRAAQRRWAGLPLGERLRCIRGVRHAIARVGRRLSKCVRHAQRRSAVETLTAEVLPLADACRFLEREAASLLRPRRLGGSGRPLWLYGSRFEVRRDPVGIVLVVGPSNYPLLLPGVQAVQALAAGNGVILKPGRGGRLAAESLAVLFRESGIDEDLVLVLSEAHEDATLAIRAGVDKVVLTGSATTGRAVLAEAAPRLLPCVMELSGCDAAYVRADADLKLAAAALRFGVTMNGGATCVAPRRILVAEAIAQKLEQALIAELAETPPVELEPETNAHLRDLIEDALARGARLAHGNPADGPVVTPIVVADATPEMRLLSADIFAPVLSIVPVRDDEHALELDARCPYALGASVFGEAGGASALASRIDAGVVVINDMIVPTADPRVPFGGRRESGFGATRGGEGLLEMTNVRVIASRSGRWRPHFRPTNPSDEARFLGYLGATHGRTLADRLRGWVSMISGREPASRTTDTRMEK